MTSHAAAHPFGAIVRSRIVAALCVSILIHLALPYYVSGGSPGLRFASQSPRTLTVRVLPQESRPESAPLAQVPAADAQTVMPAPVRTAAERVPKTAVDVAAERPATSSRDAAMPDAPDLTYYAAKQLDVYPSLTVPVDLRYDGEAAARGITGRALLLVLIDELGTVNEVNVVEAEPADTFEDDAKRAFLDARFTPAYRNGRAVRSRVLIEVNYGAPRGSP
jgi:protein TonB